MQQGGVISISASTAVGSALAILVAIVGAAPAQGQAVGRCRAQDPTGYFGGVATSQQSGRLEVSLNLRCAAGRYDGALVTPLGTFAIRGGWADSAQLHLVFAIGADVGTIDAAIRLDTLHGRFAVADDRGTLALARLGEARATAWEAPTLALGAAQWREDLAFFARELVARHGNAFHSLARPRFDSLVAALDRRLDSLTGDQVYVELDRIANLIGDGHTYVALPDDTPRFPFAVRRFGPDYRVIAVARGHERLLGLRLVQVADVPTPRVIERLWALTPAAETAALRQARAEGFLSVGTMLHGLGLTPARDAVTLTLADDAGQHVQLEVRAVPTDTAATFGWTEVFVTPPLYAQRPDQSFWCQELPAARAVYCNFRGYDSLPARAAELLALLDRMHPEKLVIDLRQNGGGDYTLGLRYLIEPIRRLGWLNRRGHLFVAIGPNTFSAAMANAAQFRTRTAALLVGEMIGERPNGFAEVRELRLPHSHLVVRYSIRYYHFVAHGPNAVLPDYRVAPTWAEYRAGQDPVLEWIVRYPHVTTVPTRRNRTGE